MKTSLLSTVPIVAAVIGMAVTPVPALASCVNPWIGQICVFAGPYCPQGFLPADGRSVVVANHGSTEYTTLCVLIQEYSLRATGVSSVQDCRIPDLRGLAPVAVGQGKNLPGYSLGSRVGADSVTLTADNVPPHTHEAVFTPVTEDRTVTVPATGGTLALKDAVVPVNAGAAGSVAPSVSAGQTVYPTNATATNGPSNYLKGLYTTSPPSGTDTATMPVKGTIAGTAPKAAIDVPLSVAVGGTVSVDPGSGSAAPIPVQSPTLTMTMCIAYEGYFPTRDSQILTK